MKYTRRQICEALSYWQKQLLNESNVPVISSIQEFLDVCKKQGVEVEKKKVVKQPKPVDARIAKEKEEVFSRESKRIKGKGEKADKGDLIVDDVKKDEKKAGMEPYHFAYVVKKESIPQYYEVKGNGDSITGDNTKWKKHGRILDYYLTPIDVDVKVRWQDEPLHATKGYSLVINVDKNGEPDPTDISPVAPEIFKDPLFWKPVDSVNESMYSRRQIMEAISYWNKQLKQINESNKKINEGYIDNFLTGIDGFLADTASSIETYFYDRKKRKDKIKQDKLNKEYNKKQEEEQRQKTKKLAEEIRSTPLYKAALHFCYYHHGGQLFDCAAKICSMTFNDAHTDNDKNDVAIVAWSNNDTREYELSLNDLLKYLKEDIEEYCKDDHKLDINQFSFIKDTKRNSVIACYGHKHSFETPNLDTYNDVIPASEFLNKIMVYKNNNKTNKDPSPKFNT